MSLTDYTIYDTTNKFRCKYITNKYKNRIDFLFTNNYVKYGRNSLVYQY